MADKIVAMFAYPATLVILPGVSKFFIKSPSLPVRAQNLPANTYRGLFQKCFINFIISEISKRRIKKELDLVLLFELFSIGKNKTEQSNCIWLEINQSNCTIHVRKLAWFSHAVMNVRNIRKALGWFSESIPTLSRMIFLHYAKISRHLQVFELRGLAGTCLVMSQASSSATTHN